jgi:hypothetical protein
MFLVLFFFYVTLPYTNNCYWSELRRDGKLSSGQLNCFSDTNTALRAVKENEEQDELHSDLTR